MSTPLLPTMLEVGLNAIWRGSNDGVAAQITHIALGDAGYAPNQGQAGLRSERARYPVADGKRVSPRQIHVTALADGNTEFWVREVGFYLADGTCLAVWSDPAKPLAYKAPGIDLLLAYDLNLSAVPADSVTVQSTGAGLSLNMAGEYASLAKALVQLQRTILKPYLQ
ncbi:phage tail protein [Undibacterium jejuense]|uniref:phage tail-collar fiber domain-containing protein n=1 Tax=Undibacterium jejuense TaxID=1344949 RepID=UPI001C9B3D52|nr:phage tail protein [Undibacterium jejuense]